MWQSTHIPPAVLVSWWVCEVASYFERRWHAAQTAFPARRVVLRCASWQSPQVTPARYILLCRNEPYSYTSSCC